MYLRQRSNTTIKPRRKTTICKVQPKQPTTKELYNYTLESLRSNPSSFVSRNSKVDQSISSQVSRKSSKLQLGIKQAQNPEETVKNLTIKTQRTLKSIPQSYNMCCVSPTNIKDRETPEISEVRQMSPESAEFKKPVNLRYAKSTEFLAEIESQRNQYDTNTSKNTFYEEESSLFSIAEYDGQLQEDIQKNQNEEIEEIRMSSIDFQKSVSNQLQMTKGVIQNIKSGEVQFKGSTLNFHTSSQESICLNQNTCKFTPNRILKIQNQILQLERAIDKNERQKSILDMQNQRMSRIIDTYEFYSHKQNKPTCTCSIF